MTVKFVCPSCHGDINKSENSSDGGTTIIYQCVKCGEFYPTRDDTPVLVYPKPNMNLLEVMYSGGSVKRRRSFFLRAYELFRYRIKTSGWVVALRMVPSYAWAKLYNRVVIVFSNLFPRNMVECSCCGWKGLKFGIFWGTHRSLYNFACPNCGSHPRHRMLSLYIPKWIDVSSQNILHFAPEEFLDKLFKNADMGDCRTTTDITLSGVSCLSNINHLPFEDSSFDSLICIHVLEHIQDDFKAMQELRRVLRPGGTAVICVPETNNTATVEFGFEDPAKSHHWRDYGMDIEDRLEESGFMVKTVTPKLLEPNYKYYGLCDNERFHLCTK